jgi:hypothetical protein
MKILASIYESHKKEFICKIESDLSAKLRVKTKLFQLLRKGLF